jgi:isopentenyldiphosphate isomerase
MLPKKNLRGEGMETEVMKIFDDNRMYLGVATRQKVHAAGYWHETFHCWFVSLEEGKVNLYFQIRSASKKDYPNLLDITAAGHILAHEKIADGVREIKEEIGIDIAYDQLIPLGIIDYKVVHKDLIDNELANVFLHQFSDNFDKFNVQIDEVSGIVKADFNEFCDFWSGGREYIRIKGFEMKDGERKSIDKKVDKSAFVQHGDSYYNDVLALIQESTRTNFFRKSV